MANQTGFCVLLALCSMGLMLQHAEASLVQAMYVFGDSTMDVGNNNYLKNCSYRARANYPRNGVDFANSTPTGRFSNGFNTADNLARLLGFPMSPPPYLSLTEQNISSQMYKGINFASGGSGLLYDTGKVLFGDVISMGEQLQNFSSVVEKMRKLSGPNGPADFLSKSLFLVCAGSNDIFEYPLHRSNDTKFLLALVDSYKSHLKTLYGLGARKFSVISTGPLGCCPSQRYLNQVVNNATGCFDLENNLSEQFYPMLAAVLQELPKELPGVKYSLGNANVMVAAVMKRPQTSFYKFTVLDTACCGSGPFGASGCNETAPVCPNRDNYLFWDANHPTEAAAAVAANVLFNGKQTFVYPINVQELATV